MVSFAVVTPSRGLIHSRTVAAVLANVDQATGAGHESRGWALTHDLPIPAAHERVAECGLATGADVLWFVEEDIVPPSAALLHLLARPEPIAIVDYPVGDAPTQNCAYHFGGQPLWFGLGCTRIDRAVFAALPRPWFRTDRTFTMTHRAAAMELTEVVAEVPYGGQDIYFARQAIEAGFAVGETGLLAGHARLRALGQPGVNAGIHEVDVLETVGRWT